MAMTQEEKEALTRIEEQAKQLEELAGRLSVEISRLREMGASDDPSEQPANDSTSTDARADWQCYLDRYEDVRGSGPYTESWALRHWNEFGKREGRTWGCIDVPEVDGMAAVSTIGNGFLWKPVAETTHALVVLDCFGQTKKDVRLEWSGGSETAHWRDTEGANGGRMHYWFDKPGSQYPVDSVLVLGDRRYRVPDPGRRYG